MVDALAAAVAELHAAAARAPAAGSLGSAPIVRRWVDDNVDELRACSHAAADRARIDALAEWSRREFGRLQPRLDRRLRDGFVRECHGDLHLANAVMVDGAPLLFDALEFNEELRWIDVISDIAFAFMDLLDRGVPALAWRLLGGWIEANGDWDGLALLRWYAVYRALVRAKIALLRVQQPQAPRLQRLRAQVGFAHYLALAESLVRPSTPVLVVMTGLSGSGKSRVAIELATRLGALRVRSDVERKRLAGLASDARGGAALYSAQMTQRTYARLSDIAGGLLDAGLSAVIDAASLRADERRRLARVAQSRNCAVHVVACEAPLHVLQRRIAARAQAGGDASDATLAVLAQQPGWRQARASDEPMHRVIDTDCAPDELVRRCDALAAALRHAN
jgi:predicted kinase